MPPARTVLHPGSSSSKQPRSQRRGATAYGLHPAPTGAPAFARPTGHARRTRNTAARADEGRREAGSRGANGEGDRGGVRLPSPPLASGLLIRQPTATG